MPKQRKGKGTVKTEQANRRSDKKALDAVSRTVIAGMREVGKKAAAVAAKGAHEVVKVEAAALAAQDIEKAEEDKEEAKKKRLSRHARARRARQGAKQSSAATSETQNKGEDIMPGSDPQAAPIEASVTTPQVLATTMPVAQSSAPVPATGGASGEAASVASSSPSTSTTQVTPTTPTTYIRPRWMEGRKPILSYSLNDDPTKREATFLSESIAEGYSRQIIDLSSELKEILQKEEGEKQFFEGSSIPNDQKKKAEYYKKRLEFAQKRLKLEEMKNLARKGRETGGDYNNAKLELLRWEMMVLAPAQASASAPALAQAAAAQAPANAKTTSSEKKYQQAKQAYEEFALRVSNSRLQKHLNKLLDLYKSGSQTPEMEKEAQSLLQKVKEDIELYNQVITTQAVKRGVGITNASSTGVLNNQDLKTALQTQSANLERRAQSNSEEFLPTKPERASSSISNVPTPYEQFVADRVEKEKKAELGEDVWKGKSSEEQYQIMKEAIRRRSKQRDMMEDFAKGGVKVQGAITKPGECEYKVTGGKIVEKDGKNGVSYAIEGNVNSTIKVPRRNQDGSISTTSFDVLEIVNGEPHLHLSDDLTTQCRLDVKSMGQYVENQRNAKPVVIDRGQEVEVKSGDVVSPSATPGGSKGGRGRSNSI